MKKIVSVCILLLIFSCGKNKDLTVKVNVKGLKKGTIFLKKMQDSSIITVDSFAINREEPILLYSELESPEVFFIQLNKNTSDDETITFFANKGITEINTSLKKFGIDVTINGSQQQKALENYLQVMSRFNDKNLDLIKDEFDAKRENDTAKINAVQKAFNSLVKSKYLYTVNFAIANKDSELAPYLALTEIADAQTKWLD
ncbi:MAG: DUF4369 domain-containing protein, partial [Oceanihabitans sp.]